ncbi:beta-galactosidase [Sphingobacterium detergens]|uniref:beta-galactosidase n=1 Tax=Sphingobacterium detergens TaxID=1145106 RepID=UPI003AAD2EBA
MNIFKLVLRRKYGALFIGHILFYCIIFYTSIVLAQDRDKARPIKRFAHPERIRYDGSCMTIEGKDVYIYSAAFHYFRCPEDLWRDRFKKIKEAGFNTVETYVPWNWHERHIPRDMQDQSKFDFSDLKRWLKMAQEEFGFYTIVRPGPFICAEFSGGGYPRWLAKYRPENLEGFWLRGNDEQHIAWSQHWFDAVCKELKDEQITHKVKGKKGIIMIQIENEYDAHWTPGKDKVLKALNESVKKSGMDIPVFTCLTNETRGSIDPELSQVFDCDNYYVSGPSDAPSCAYRMMDLRKKQPDAPGFVTELQGGWFSLVTGRLSEEHYSDDRHFKAIGLMTMLGGGTGINYYMFFGGTHLDGWGARGMTTSYDYNAAIYENGAIGPKYLAAKEIGAFIQKFESKLVRTEGGPCELQGAPKSLFGGVRVSSDGTKFIFLHNTDPKQAIKGRVTLLPNSTNLVKEPIYNVNQHGEKVLIKTDDQLANQILKMDKIEVEYDLAGLESKILVVSARQSTAKGDWWPKKADTIQRPSKVPAGIRISTARKAEDATDLADWNGMRQLVSLSDMDINDFRYSIYRSHVVLTAKQAEREHYLLFNMYTRDIVSVLVNGKPAKRLFPDRADAQSWTTRNAFERIRLDEYDNRFDVAGLLKAGENEIVVAYENLGHAHGYVPMEELAGIHHAGLSLSETALTHPLEWEFSTDLAGIQRGWNLPDFDDTGWNKISLDTANEIPRKGNQVQPKGKQDGLVTWYRVEFNLDKLPKDLWVPWMAKVNASGNGYMWLNGHNIGRHWEAGPQREFFLPECWLNFGSKKNVLTFGLRQTENGALLQALEILPYPNTAEVRKDR